MQTTDWSQLLEHEYPSKLLENELVDVINSDNVNINNGQDCKYDYNENASKMRNGVKKEKNLSMMIKY